MLKVVRTKNKTGPVAVKVEVYNGSLVSLVSTTYSWTQVAESTFICRS